jgi:hypothetical protein
MSHARCRRRRHQPLEPHGEATAPWPGCFWPALQQSKDGCAVRHSFAERRRRRARSPRRASCRLSGTLLPQPARHRLTSGGAACGTPRLEPATHACTPVESWLVAGACGAVLFFRLVGRRRLLGGGRNYGDSLSKVLRRQGQIQIPARRPALCAERCTQQAGPT